MLPSIRHTRLEGKTMTTTSKPATTNAFAPYVLKTDTLFVREEEGWELDLLLPAGATVRMRQVPTLTGVDVVMRYADAENNEWECVKKLPLPRPAQSAPPATVTTAATLVIAPSAASAQPAAPTPPVVPSAETKAAQDSTAYDVRAALGFVAARQVSAADDDERRVRRLAAQAEMLSGNVYQVNYYIPTDSEMDNPSRILRRHGFRLDGSNWVMPAKGLEHKDVQKIKREFDNAKNTPAQGRKPYMWVIKYTREQLAEMREMAQERLAEELRGVHCSLIERIDSAAERLREAQEEIAAAECPSQKDRDKAMAANTGALRAAVNEACERFQMCLKGAEIFDDTGSLDALFGSVRDVIRAQATAVNATLRLRGVKTVAVSI